jgi:hypothetical protein
MQIRYCVLFEVKYHQQQLSVSIAPTSHPRVEQL